LKATLARITAALETGEKPETQAHRGRAVTPRHQRDRNPLEAIPMPRPKKEPTPIKKRSIRTPEEIIRDLEAEIERVKNRAQARKAKRSPELRNLVLAVKAIDASLADAKDAALKQALTEGRVPLVAYLQLEGIPVPKKRGPKAKRKAPGLAAATA
jgi:hypothetical protein